MASEKPTSVGRSVVDIGGSGEAKAVCFSGVQSRNVRRIVETGEGVCRHVCAHHAEVMDPCLWSRLPEHLLAHVFARLPLLQIPSLGWLSKAWFAMSKTSSFKQLCAEVRSKMFGVLGFNSSVEQFQVAAFDLKECKWMYKELKHLPRGYRKHRRGLNPVEYEDDADYVEDQDRGLYSHDGGLVCFASTNYNLPILVCNPLTNEWKVLPSIALWKQPIMVQLITDSEKGGYRVMVLCRRREVDYDSSGAEGAGVFGSETAELYDSQTGLWSTMNSGFVYGLDHIERNLPKVFDCKLGRLISLCPRECLKGTSRTSPLLIDSTIVKGHLFALHAAVNHGRGRNFSGGSVYEISELVGPQDNPGALEVLHHYKSTLGSEYNNYTTLLFATDGFILLVADNGEENSGEFHHQLVRLYDVSRDEWHKLPALNDIYTVYSTVNHLMCELLWDAVP